MHKINAMTVDVEDYFQVAALEPYIEKAYWDSLPHRVERNTHRILDLFASRQIKATFFTLGWVAERYPALIKRIVVEGHELACHGYAHQRVTELSPAQFRADISKAKKILQDIGGIQVKGYRAPTYSIGAKNLWALDVLLEEGFKYSSSIYPVKHDLYGMPEAPRFMFEPIANHDFKEIPITTLKLGHKNWPCGGGGFFRFYPYALSKWAFQQVNDKDQQAGVFYFHPWEIDPKQPKQQGLSLKAKTRHYLNLHKMEARISRLLTDFQWDTMEKVFLK
ncbi:XrtA system polysaccharide deacetylase [Crenothrix polyspora]|uniref:Polysaccharide deacetylase domain protein n=1 Tax=Crenothrix polyspora TaxID=360316 RepID=A0A1R4HD17_9GAMM|nr:XrtA system polysaccharide deacetylase [Crenothrix polyspora]SJM94122.1 Polysaccharide deacetylase domain protein [Crenothrix polyspora]